MKTYILILELAYISGVDGFSLRNVEAYAAISRYKGRVYLSELIEMRWIARRANRFYVTLHGAEVYEAITGGQTALFTPEHLRQEPLELDADGYPF